MSSLGIDQGWCSHPGHAPPISQDPEVGTPKPQNPHRKRMEFGGEDGVQEALPLEPTVPLHLEDLKGF